MIVVLGAGGHARVVLDILHPLPCVLLDRDAARWYTEMMGVPILGSDDLLPTLRGKDFTIGLASVGVPHLRKRLYEAAIAAGLLPITIAHRTAALSQFAEVGRGAQLFANSVVNAGAVLGENVIVNTGAIVEHDCHISDHVHIATGARLTGAVTVGTGAFIGAGSVIRQGISIGAEAVVGAGSVVVKDVPPQTTVAGNPARPLAKSERQS